MNLNTALRLTWPRQRAAATAAPISTLVTGLVSYWQLDEESGARADSIGVNTLTDTNTVGYAAGLDGNAGSFVATNLEHLISPAATIDWTDGVTFAAWINQTTMSPIACKDNYNYTGPAREWAVVKSSNQVTAYFFNALGAEQHIANTAFASLLGTWVLCIAWWDPADGYVRLSANNGTPTVSTGTITNVMSSAQTIVLGRHGAVYFNGLMDGVGLWNRALTTDEMTELYADGDGSFYDDDTENFT